MYRYFMVILGLIGLTGAIIAKNYIAAMLWVIVILQDLEIRKLEKE